MDQTQTNLKNHIVDLIQWMGEDPSREGLQRTPERVLKSYQFFSVGYQQSLETLLNGALFEAPYSELVMVQDIEFYSLCEHHMVPFFGKCHVGYLPNKKIIGLSKIPRIVEMFSRRLQVQERLTAEIANCLHSVLQPYGVGVVMEAQHMCMMMRGVQKQSAFAKTSSLLGSFRDGSTRQEFFNLIKK